MPSTRRSLPATATTAAGSAPSTSCPAPVAKDELSEKQKREMRRLNIDAKSTIVGDLKEAKKSEVQGEVYHYRGAVYKVTGNEPEEWLQQEPERFKTKKRKVDDADGGSEEVNERKKKRVGDVKGAASDGPSPKRTTTIPSTSSKKRKNSTSINSKMDTTTTSTKRNRSSDATDETTDDPPRKQARTTTTTAPAPPTRLPKPKKKTRRPPPTAADQRAARHAEKMRFDFTVNGGHDTISTSQARAQAIAAGYQVTPLPQSTLDAGRAARREELGDATSRFVRQLAVINEEIKKNEREWKELKEREAERERLWSERHGGRARKVGEPVGKCVVELPGFAARRAAALARRDSGLGMGDAEGEGEVDGKAKSVERFSEDRAEEVLRQGRLVGESFEERDRRFERERKVINEMFRPGGDGGTGE